MSKQEIEQIWEINKPLLWSLWVKDRKPMKELRVEMQKRGFSATESQYKRHFEDWGFQQKISAENWKVIGHRVEKRKREGLDSAVVIDGVCIPKRKVQKEISRHFFQTKELMNNPNPPLPGTALVSILSPPSFSILDVGLTWSDEMPWIKFINTHFRNTSFQQSYQGDLTRSSSTITSRRTNTDVAVWLDFLPNMDILANASRMAARMPECFSGQHLLDSQTLDLGRPCDTEQVKVKLVLYQMANNFEISEAAFELFYNVMSQSTIIQFPETSMSFKGLPKAILESAFRWAIRMRRYDILRWTLDLGVSPSLKTSEWSYSGSYHLPFVSLLGFGKSADAEDMIDLLMEYEKPSSRGIINQHCCEHHGSLLNCAARSAGVVALRSLLKRELELHGLKFLNQLDFTELLLMIADTEPGVAERKINCIVDVYSQIHNSSDNLIKGLLCTKGLLEAVEKGSHALIHHLHQNGADFNCHDEFGNFPLGVCCQNCSTYHRIKMLLELGASASYTPRSETGINLFSVFHYLVLDTDPETCLMLLHHGADPNALGSHPEYSPTELITPLQFSLSVGKCFSTSGRWGFNFDVPCLLLDHGALLMGDELVRFAQHATATTMYLGDIDTVVKRLVAEGANLEWETEAGETALEISIRNDITALALALVRAGSRPRVTTSKKYKWLLGLRVIHDLRAGHIGIVDCIACIQGTVSWAPEVTSDLWIELLETIDDEPQLFAAESESLTPVLFLDIGQLPEECHMYALEKFADWATYLTGKARQSAFDLFEGMLNVVQPLECPAPCGLRQGFIPRIVQKLAFFYELHPDVFDTFVSRLVPCQGIECDFSRFHEDPFAALYSANYGEQATEREQLLSKLFARGFLPTTLAGLSCVSRGTVKEIQMYIDHGFNPKRRYPWLSTALQIASFRGDPQIIALLLGSGVHVNSRPAWRSRADTYDYVSGDGMPFRSHTALQAAVSKGNQEHIKLLLDAGADVNAKPAPVAGATALQLAALNGDVGIANWLIAGYGADPNAPGAPTLGRTALEGAAEQGRLEMVYLLLQSGCLIVGDGRPQFIRAVIRAEDNQHQALASILRKEGQWSSIDDEQYRVHKEAMDVERRIEAKMKHGEYFGPAWDQASDGECCDDSACDCCLDN